MSPSATKSRASLYIEANKNLESDYFRRVIGTVVSPNLEQKGVVPEVMFDIFEKLCVSFGNDIPLTMKFPRMVMIASRQNHGSLSSLKSTRSKSRVGMFPVIPCSRTSFWRVVLKSGEMVAADFLCSFFFSRNSTSKSWSKKDPPHHLLALASFLAKRILYSRMGRYTLAFLDKTRYDQNFSKAYHYGK
ncbi:hypothetical protein Tco_1192304 [Tanacetum coccineum]